ncbi:hypothetical protein [Paraburkholderia terricola]|nr:hypothetical protein [Paraburkholderia terricola]
MSFPAVAAMVRRGILGCGTIQSAPKHTIAQCIPQRVMRAV